MLLRESHEKLKKYILCYFSLYDVDFIPTTNCSVIDKGKVLIFFVFLGMSAFFSGWHLFFQMTSMENLLDFTYNFNLVVAGIQTIITLVTVNFIYKSKFLTILEFFDDLTESYDEFLTKAREDHLQSSISIAWTLKRTFFIGASIVSIPLSFVGLIETNFISPLFYTIPGISPDSNFYYPLNIIFQPLHYYLLMETIVATDCLVFIYLFYFRGEIYAINSVAELLNDKRTLHKHCHKILLTIHKAHKNVLNKFSIISNVMWHFYGQKFFVVSLYLCASIFVFMKVTNTNMTGIILLTFVLGQLVLLSVPGQLIDDCSETLRTTLYMILWYEMKLKDQKNLLVLMIGAQKSIQPETLGIGQISIYTFVQIVKLAFSYAAFAYAVLL